MGVIIKNISGLLFAILFTGCSNGENFGFFEDHGDIGNCNIEGNMTYDPVKNQYLLKGSGENIWFGNDQFHYAWFEVSGDILIRTRMEFIGEGVQAHRKAGIMFRNHLDSSSVHFSATVHGDGLTGLQYRLSDGADMSEVKSEASGPMYFQLEREGDVCRMVTGDQSGIIDTVEFTTSALDETYYAGIFVCSHDNSVSEEAVFSDIDVWQSADSNMESFDQYINQ
ncbi:MAG: hypothetical protein K9J30_14970 [Bacteroidales bacterium]|nr:hypothetical protein [Bacteroidales bacterium]